MPDGLSIRPGEEKRSERALNDCSSWMLDNIIRHSVWMLVVNMNHQLQSLYSQQTVSQQKMSTNLDKHSRLLHLSNVTSDAMTPVSGLNHNCGTLHFRNVASDAMTPVSCLDDNGRLLHGQELDSLSVSSEGSLDRCGSLM